MLRPTLTRRALTGGLALAAVASTAGVTLPASAATPHASTRLVTHFDASDTNFSVLRVGRPLATSSGTVAYVQITNPSTSLTLNVDRDFVVAGYNAAGAVIATASPSTSNLFEEDNSVPPGQTGVVKAEFTVPGIDHVAVTNASGDLSEYLPDRFNLVGNPTVTPNSDGTFEITGTVNNPTGVPQTAEVLVLAQDSAGHLLGQHLGFTAGSSVPANGNGTFDTYYSPAPGEVPASFTYIVDGLPFESTAEWGQVASSAQSKGAVYQGSTVDLFPTMTINNAAAVGKTIEVVTHALGQPTQVIGTGTTDSTGKADIKVQLPGPVQLFFEFPGDATTLGSTSGDLSYTQSQAHLTFNGANTVKVGSTKVKPSARPGIKARTQLTFTGSYINLGKSEKIELQQKINNHWRKVASATNLKGTGSFSIKLKAPSHKGTFQFRLHVGGNLYHSDLVSHLTYTVRVK